MPYFSLKTKDPSTVRSILARNTNIEFTGINVLQEALVPSTPVFIVLGGDRPAWETGLIGMGVISRAPYDIGYEGRNFKVQVDIKLLLPHPIKREDLVPYKDTYGTIGIAPITKWEPNQALSQVADRNAVALMRAMIELFPTVYEELHSFVGERVFSDVLSPTTKMFPYAAAYGVDERDAVQNFLSDCPADTQEETQGRTSHGDNILLYGVPGCGKSYTIKTEYCDDDEHMERAVFHPDYTYSDFVGQILPRINGDRIEYVFAPGPFTRILKKANDSPSELFFLVIEEINRGNAPAIFGDIFQLLDRDRRGYSEYGVSNESIASFAYGDETRKVIVPGNLFILATMNTSDQNVFTLDTAFKRRWTMRMIENDIDACEFAHRQICAWGVTWGVFAKTINEKIIELGENNLSNEDNRLGAYFVREEDLSDAERFGEKVLMYLWNDAFKFNHDKIFKPEYRTLDELITAFIRDGFAVFNEEYITFETDVAEAEELIETDIPTLDQYLEGKNPVLVEAHNRLFEAVRARIPLAYGGSVGSLSYAAWKSNDTRKASFTDVRIQRDRMVLFTETPTEGELLALGTQLPIDNHRNHYFQVVFDENRFDQIVSIIVESYNQLKVQ